MRSLTTLVRSWIDNVDEVAARRMMASELASALTMVGGLKLSSVGRLRRLPMASRRSLAATLMSVFWSNSMVTWLWPALDEDEIDTTPGVRATAPSMTLVTSLSIVSGVAPVIVGADGDDRAVDIGQFADLDAAPGGQAGDHDRAG